MIILNIFFDISKIFLTLLIKKNNIGLNIIFTINKKI